MSARTWTAGALGLAVLAAGLSAAPALADEAGAAPATPPVVGLIVTPTGSSLPRGVVSGAEDLLDADVTATTRGVDGTYALRLDETVTADDAEQAARALAARADVAAAEPDHLLRTASPSPVSPADPFFSQQSWLWDAAAASPGGFSDRAPAFWQDRGRGASSIVVAVVDTGITSHPDLAGQLVSGYDMISDATEARDGGGRDADPRDEGDWVDASTARRCTGDDKAKAQSSSWHGTHVAGIVAAEADNGLGVTGAAPGVRVQPVRALGRCGGAESDVAAAITWASGGAVPGVPANPTRASVVSLSLGGYGARCGTAMQAAVDGARSRGVVVVAAAGNEGGDVRLSNPAGCSGVVAVGASTGSGALAPFSNRGAGLALSAPGVAVLSTLNNGSTTPGSATVGAMSGTSQAAPQVAAAAALVRSADAGLPVGAVETALRQAVRPYASASPGGGTGVLDLSRLMAARTAPQVVGAGSAGATLTATPAQWVLGTFASRQWLRDGVAIPGANGPTYRLGRADVGHHVSVSETPRSAVWTGNPLGSNVVALPSWASSVRLKASRKVARFGRDGVRLRVVVAGRDGRPSGTVTVYDGRKKLRTVRLTKGRATVTLGARKLRARTHRLRAVYTPSAPTYAPSASARVKVVVRR